MPLVQDTDAYIDNSLPGDIVLAAPPTPGNMLILAMWCRSAELVPDAIPDGFQVAVERSTAPSGFLASWAIAWRVAETGDSDTWESPASGARRAYLAEWSGLLPPDDTEAVSLFGGSYASAQSIAPSGSAGDLIFALFGINTDIAGRECAIDGDTTPLLEDWTTAGQLGPYGSFGYIEQLGSATADFPVTAFHDGAKIAANFPVGTVDPGDPPVDPGFDPPEPGRAILEIYVHDEDASRWGVATWATGPATGTEGIWSAAGWEDITPQGVNAHIIWGARRPDRGILAEQDGATWNIETYDPERILDPGNPDSPFAPQLVAGVPIRISHDGLVIRTGYIDRLRYRHKAPDYRGEIQATSTIALVHRAEVPEDSLLGDTLLERVDDAIVAAEVAVGGLPVRGVLFEAGTGPALSPRIVGSATLWTHIRRAAQEALYVAFERADASIGLRPWGVPLDRSSEITYENLEDLETAISEDGVYSVVRVNNADDTLVIERVAAPLPRYGRRVYERTETTEDPEGWADAILADRAWPGVQYIPGTVHAFTAADVAFLGSLEIMERLTITVPGVVSVSGRILGMELWVAQTRDAPRGATWQFLPRVATDGSTAIGTTTLVADFTGDTLVDDDTGTDYLEAD